MLVRIFLPALLVAVSLGACGGLRDTADEFGSSATGGFARGDTYGTQRRVDVYGGSTAPSLPTIGQPGFGK